MQVLAKEQLDLIQAARRAASKMVMSFVALEGSRHRSLRSVAKDRQASQISVGQVSG